MSTRAWLLLGDLPSATGHSPRDGAPSSGCQCWAESTPQRTQSQKAPCSEGPHSGGLGPASCSTVMLLTTLITFESICAPQPNQWVCFSGSITHPSAHDSGRPSGQPSHHLGKNSRLDTHAGPSGLPKGPETRRSPPHPSVRFLPLTPEAVPLDFSPASLGAQARSRNVPGYSHCGLSTPSRAL